MHNIELVHEGQDYIKVSYKENGKKYEAEITGISIDIIKTLAKALQKPTFLKES